jgi:hypothetical protein
VPRLFIFASNVRVLETILAKTPYAKQNTYTKTPKHLRHTHLRHNTNAKTPIPDHLRQGKNNKTRIPKHLRQNAKTSTPQQQRHNTNVKNPIPDHLKTTNKYE